jgi:hypothetical protein
VDAITDQPELFDKSQEHQQAELLNDAAMAILEDREGLPSAIAMLRRAQVLLPSSPDIISNLGIALWQNGQIAEAMSAFRLAISMEPGRAAFHGNYGVFLSAVSYYGKAETHLERAAKLDPSSKGPLWDLALLCLREGNWERGLALYDIRREHRGTKLYPNLIAPMWRGEDLTGKTIYIQAEQGIGDRFLFSRYFAWMKRKWPTCRILFCPFDTLINVFWNYTEIVELMNVGLPWPKDIDYATYICSLPEIHGTRPDYIPDDPGYLRDRIQQACEGTKLNLPIPNLPSIKVGIVWTGNPEQRRNHERSIPLADLLRLAEDPRITLYSFQCGVGRADINRIHAGDLVCDLGSDIEKEGWVGTGVALMEMDVVITVCTSVAHFAAAIEVPTWVILCADPYWIWGRDGSTTPWYPNARLFRQTTIGDWRGVIQNLRTALGKLADEKL